MVTTLEPYRDQSDGFGLLLPKDWERVDPPADEVRLVAVEPLADQGFRTNVVVTLDDLPEGLTLEGWQDGNDLMMPTMLEAWQLLDRVTERRDSETDGSTTVVRRLGHHNQGGVPVTMRQVALMSRRRGLTLTTSIWTPAYPSVLGLVARIERSFPSGSGDEGSRRDAG
jgi:hypothetical protein